MFPPVARIGNLWNRSPFLSPKKRVWTATQEEMRYEDSTVKAPLPSRRRMTPPTPLQKFVFIIRKEQEHFEVEDQMWSARDRTIIAKTKQYLEERKSLKVEIEELESLVGPEDTDVYFRRIREKNKGRKWLHDIFETFSTDGPSEFLVVSRSRWDKYQNKWNAPWRQNRLFFK